VVRKLQLSKVPSPRLLCISVGVQTQFYALLAVWNFHYVIVSLETQLRNTSVDSHEIEIEAGRVGSIAARCVVQKLLSTLDVNNDVTVDSPRTSSNQRLAQTLINLPSSTRRPLPSHAIITCLLCVTLLPQNIIHHPNILTKPRTKTSSKSYSSCFNC
jgi:hypothetical protein